MPQRIIKLLRTQTIWDSLISFSGQIGSSVLGAVFFAFIFRFLGKTDFGIFSLAYATAIIIRDLVDPAVNAALLRFIPGSDTKTAHGFTKYLIELKVIYFLILIPPFLLFNQWISLLIFKRVALGLIPLILFTAVTLSAATFISGLYRARRLFLSEAIYATSQTIIRLAMLGLIYWYDVVSVQTVLFVNVAAYLFIIAVALYHLRPDFLKAKVDPSIKPQVLSFLPPMVMSSVTGTVTDRINLYLTNYFLNLGSVGLLSAVTQLFKPVYQFAGALDGVLGSRFAGFTSLAQARTYLLKALGISAFLAIGLIGSNLIIAPVGSLIFGAEFLEVVHVYRIFTIGYSLFLFQPPFIAFALYYKGRSDIIASISVVQLVTTLLANFFLIPRLGLVGTAWALVIVFAVSLTTTVFLSMKVTKAQT